MQGKSSLEQKAELSMLSYTDLSIIQHIASSFIPSLYQPNPHVDR